LVAENLTGCEGQSHETDLDFRLIRPQSDIGQLRHTQIGEGVWYTPNAQSADQNARRGRGWIGLGDQTRKAQGAAEPKIAVPIGEGGLQITPSQPVGRGEVFDPP